MPHVLIVDLADTVWTDLADLAVAQGYDHPSRLAARVLRDYVRPRPPIGLDRARTLRVLEGQTEAVPPAPARQCRPTAKSSRRSGL
jgi:hypothetical protein